jgi:alpha-1,4-digalacturonate transport system substrate-binding protein
MQEVLTRFEAENPGILVMIDEVAFSEIHDVLRLQLDAGEGPDLARITFPGRFAGEYLDLRPYITDEQYWRQNFSPFILGSMQAGPDDEGLYGYPTQFTVAGPYINRSLFEAAGVPVPSDSHEEVTWEEWVAAAAEVQAALTKPGSPVYALALDRSGHRFWAYSLPNCANYIQADGALLADSPGFRASAEQLYNWHLEGLTPLEIWAGAGDQYVAADQFFTAGQVAFYYSGSWQVSLFEREIGESFIWEAVPNPVGECGRSGMPGGAVVTAFAGTQHPEALARLMDFLVQDESLRFYYENALSIPGHLGMIESGLSYPANNETLNTFTSQIPFLMDEAYALQYHPQSGDINGLIRRYLSEYISDLLTLDEALAGLQTELDALSDN